MQDIEYSEKMQCDWTEDSEVGIRAEKAAGNWKGTEREISERKKALKPENVSNSIQMIS